MIKIMRRFAVVIPVLVWGATATGQIPTADELVTLYEKSLVVLNRAIYTVDSNINVVEGIEWPADISNHFTVSREGLRRATSGFVRATLKSGEVAEETNTTFILDKRAVFVRSHNKQPQAVYLLPEKDLKKDEVRSISTLGAGVITDGILPGNEGEKLPDMLRACSNLKVRDVTEKIDGQPTYILEGQGKEGKVILWLDPDAAYHPRKVELNKTDEDLLYGQHVASDRYGRPEFANKKLKEYNVLIDSVKIEEVNGIFLMTAGKLTETRTYTDGSKFVIGSNFRITNIKLNPDFDVLKPFEIKVPDGTKVNDADFPGGNFEVRQGKIVSAGASFEQIDKTIDQRKKQ